MVQIFHIFIGFGFSGVDCDSLQQENERVYNRADWIDSYLKLLYADLQRIMPPKNSRLFENFHKKCTELIDILTVYKTKTPVYRKTNLVSQRRLNLV